jgi:hypothetical protein
VHVNRVADGELRDVSSSGTLLDLFEDFVRHGSTPVGWHRSQGVETLVTCDILHSALLLLDTRHKSVDVCCSFYFRCSSRHWRSPRGCR